MTNAQQTKAEAFISQCREHFGETPEDVLGVISHATDVMLWLSEIFTSIEKAALNSSNGYRVQRLARAGGYITESVGNVLDCQHGDFAEKLREAGVIPPKSI